MLDTYEKFITQIEAVYGAYKKELKLELLMYLPNKIKESDLNKLYWKLREEYTTQFKTPPDLTLINNMIKPSEEQINAEAAEWYDKIARTGNSLDNVIISDIRAHKALLSIGGWVAFCQRSPEYENLHRKNFISAFSKIIVDVNETPCIMCGESNRRDKEPIYIGDKEKCLAIANIKSNINIEFKGVDYEKVHS